MPQAKLAPYLSKRDFTRTQEPQGAEVGESDGLFIVQKHAARRLHYDLRLAHDGVLLSWAVTRGPSRNPADKRLAVRTEDHPLDYAEFEGTIPKGEYGGGTVMLWDRGQYRVEGDVGEAIAEGKLKISFEGERLNGGYTLVRIKGRPKENRENWLLIKERDDLASEEWTPDEHATSITTGRTMDEIATGAKSRQVFRKKAPVRKSAAKTMARKQATSRKLPTFVPPQLATLAQEAPQGDNWLHEVKYDGYRLLAAVDGEAVRLYTRSGLDWTEKFGAIAQALAKLDLPPVLLDGEVTAAGKGGSSDFSALQRTLKEGRGDLAYFVFDLLTDDGEDIRSLPLTQRKERLEAYLTRAKGAVRYSDHIRGKGDRVAANACKMGLEGIIAKRADSPYRSTRSRDWLKIKCVKRQEFVIGGYTPSTKKRAFSSLIVGFYEGDELHYAGRVGTGFDDRTLRDLGAAMEARARKTSPFARVPADVARKAKWCEPELVAEINFTEMTDSGSLRHPVFMGLREDKPARSITMEKPVAPPPAKAASKAPPPEVKVRLTSPDKVLFPTMGITKRDLASYLQQAAPRMLPHLMGRPVSLVRCPAGRGKSCFFQKHVGKGMPDTFGKVAVSEKDAKKADYILIETEEALVSCAQVGALELHVWGSRKDRLEQPDRVVFDLDPGDDVDFEQVKKASRELAAILEEGGLVSFPLVTGGKGVHIVVPLNRRHEWAVTAGFARDFAQKMAEVDPDRFVATMTKARRGGKIFIDHFRNGRGATAIAPYSPRAREGAPVAMPVTWEELAGLKAANLFSIDDARARLSQADPWEDYDSVRQSLTKAGLKRIGLRLGS
jgi:bifunctional non-homologous end joining protein LigD